MLVIHSFSLYMWKIFFLRFLKGVLTGNRNLSLYVYFFFSVWIALFQESLLLLWSFVLSLVAFIISSFFKALIMCFGIVSSYFLCLSFIELYDVWVYNFHQIKIFHYSSNSFVFCFFFSFSPPQWTVIFLLGCLK